MYVMYKVVRYDVIAFVTTIIEAWNQLINDILCQSV